MKPDIIFPCRSEIKTLTDKISKEGKEYNVQIDYCNFDSYTKEEGPDDVDVGTLEVSDDSFEYVKGTRCFDVTVDDVYIFMYDNISEQRNLYDGTVITFWKYEAKSWNFEIYKMYDNKYGAAGAYESLVRNDFTGVDTSTLTFKITKIIKTYSHVTGVMVHVYDGPLSYQVESPTTLDIDSVAKLNAFYNEINQKYGSRPLKKIAFGFKDNTYSDSSSVSFGGNIIDDNLMVVKETKTEAGATTSELGSIEMKSLKLVSDDNKVHELKVVETSPGSGTYTLALNGTALSSGGGGGTTDSYKDNHMYFEASDPDGSDVITIAVYFNSWYGTTDDDIYSANGAPVGGGIGTNEDNSGIYSMTFEFNNFEPTSATSEYGSTHAISSTGTRVLFINKSVLTFNHFPPSRSSSHVLVATITGKKSGIVSFKIGSENTHVYARNLVSGMGISDNGSIQTHGYSISFLSASGVVDTDRTLKISNKTADKLISPDPSPFFFEERNNGLNIPTFPSVLNGRLDGASDIGAGLVSPYINTILPKHDKGTLPLFSLRSVERTNEQLVIKMIYYDKEERVNSGKSYPDIGITLSFRIIDSLGDDTFHSAYINSSTDALHTDVVHKNTPIESSHTPIEIEHKLAIPESMRSNDKLYLLYAHILHTTGSSIIFIDSTVKSDKPGLKNYDTKQFFVSPPIVPNTFKYYGIFGLNIPTFPSELDGRLDEASDIGAGLVSPYINTILPKHDKGTLPLFSLRSVERTNEQLVIKMIYYDKEERVNSGKSYPDIGITLSFRIIDSLGDDTFHSAYINSSTDALHTDVVHKNTPIESSHTPIEIEHKLAIPESMRSNDKLYLLYAHILHTTGSSIIFIDSTVKSDKPGLKNYDTKQFFVSPPIVLDTYVPPDGHVTVITEGERYVLLDSGKDELRLFNNGIVKTDNNKLIIYFEKVKGVENQYKIVSHDTGHYFMEKNTFSKTGTPAVFTITYDHDTNIFTFTKMRLNGSRYEYSESDVVELFIVEQPVGTPTMTETMSYTPTMTCTMTETTTPTPTMTETCTMTETTTPTPTVTETVVDELFLSEGDGYKTIKEFGEDIRVMKYFSSTSDGASAARFWMHDKIKDF